jgi:hypothetical protein
MQKILFKINANKNINYQIILSFELVMTYYAFSLSFLGLQCYFPPRVRQLELRILAFR